MESLLAPTFVTVQKLLQYKPYFLDTTALAYLDSLMKNPMPLNSLLTHYLW